MGIVETFPTQFLVNEAGMKTGIIYIIRSVDHNTDFTLQYIHTNYHLYHIFLYSSVLYEARGLARGGLGKYTHVG